MYFQIHNFYNTDRNNYSKFASYKPAILLIMFIIIDAILKNIILVYYSRLLQIIFIIGYITGFIELMLMQLITNSIKDKYKTINNKLSTKSHQIALNKTHPPNSPHIFNLQDIVIKDNKRRAKVVEQLMAEHFQLTAMAKKANKLFGLPLLITFSLLFQTITICIYFTIYIYSISYNLSLFFIILTVWWCIVVLFHTWLLVHVWDSLANEVSILQFLSF